MKKWGMLVLSLLILFGMFPTMSLAAQSKTFDIDLSTYLKEVSEIRGSEVTKDDIEYALYSFDETLSLDDFKTIEELKDFLGEPIASDLHNLNSIYMDYNLNEKSLKALLKENGLTIDDFIYEEDLYYAVYLYTEGSVEVSSNHLDETEKVSDLEELSDLLGFLQDEFGLTVEEMDRINAHLSSINDEVSDLTTLYRLNDVGTKLTSFKQLKTAKELKPDQIADLLSIYNEIASIFHIKSSFVLIQGDSEKPLSFVNLMNLEELKRSNLKITLSTTEGRFLADLVLTGDMVNSNVLTAAGEELQKPAEQAKESSLKEANSKAIGNNTDDLTTEKEMPVAAKKIETIVENKQDVAPLSKEVKNLKHTKNEPVDEGKVMPETATNYLLVIMLGVAVAMLGLLVYRSVKKV
ncbi:processed acidic surface protein [Priestia megaterium]|uniref:processed acidic surface protein n=1 Tax=Priestia megaterium TaxID=1404 RepID=UPI002E22550B|nr:processed acidic surface protein [Priestia megaterium]MED4284858.1 processed acidic surface protein [Priestia megaterium]